MNIRIREAVDVYFKAKSDFKLGARTIRKGEPVLIFDTVQTSTMEVTAEVTYVTGGRGNARILSYEGDKVLSFNFTEALLSAEGLAILSGADLLNARNSRLPGASPEAKSVISHYTEKYSVATGNIPDDDTSNNYALDATINGRPRGGVLNVWLTRKPYVGQNSSIYVMLLDDAGEMSGAPIEINLANDGDVVGDHHSYLAKFKAGDQFIAFDASGAPMSLVDFPDPAVTQNKYGMVQDQNAVFDDMVAHYVDVASATANWATAWGEVSNYTRTIKAVDEDHRSGAWDCEGYMYLLAPSGGIAQPKCFKEGSEFVYKVNVPSILYQDIVLVDYYVEYRHNATQVSIMPDKFAPYMYVEGSSLVRRASDGMDLPVEFVIPKLKITTALTFTLASTGDASTFEFTGDAYPDFTKFNQTKKVLADIQILDADDNYDMPNGSDAPADPTSYRRYRYNEDSDGEYIWKDPSMEPHSNLDYSDPGYMPYEGGPATLTPGDGTIDSGYVPSHGASINGKEYDTIEDAIADAKTGDTVVMSKDIEVDTSALTGTTGLYNIPAGVTFDGNGKTIKVSANAVAGRARTKAATGGHVIVVQGGAKSVIKNVIIEGDAVVAEDNSVTATCKAGIVASGPSVDVTIENVTIRNCGTVGVQVTNGAKVTLINYNSQGNPWGSVNADKGGGGTKPTVTFQSGTMNERAEIYCERDTVAKDDNAIVNATGLTRVIGDPNDATFFKGFTYYSSNLKDHLKVAYKVVFEKNTYVFETEEAAKTFKNANEGAGEVIAL